jgi:3-deoxy-7-phosphoheptulonate synthase
MVEVHPDPDRALSDGDQSLTLAEFRQLMDEIGPVAEAVGRSLAAPRQGLRQTGTGRRGLGWGAAG